jgi:peptidoglycan-associated lipoprotein
VSQIEPKIAENTTAIRETNEKLDVVDRRAQQAIADAAAADQKATAASQQAAAAAQAAGVADGKAAAADKKADAANQSVQRANSRFDALDIYSAGEPQVIVFQTDSDALSDEAKQALDTVASGVAGQPSGYLIEIHGFTDTTGDEKYNLSLSQRRADSALRYLVGKGVPVHRTSMVGLGEEAPE